MLCGFKQMTLASVLIVVECVNDLSLAPIVMLGVAVSMAVNWSMNERGHDEELIHRRKLPFLEPEAPHSFDSKAALDLCIPCSPLPPEAPLHQAQHNFMTPYIILYTCIHIYMYIFIWVHS